MTCMFLKRLLNVGHILENVCQCNTVLTSFLQKQRRVELKSVRNSVARTVLVESANQCILKGQFMTQ